MHQLSEAELWNVGLGMGTGMGVVGLPAYLMLESMSVAPLSETVSYITGGY